MCGYGLVKMEIDMRLIKEWFRGSEIARERKDF